jgi:hypothetical protein
MMKPHTIDDALTDRNLLGAALVDQGSWRVWRVVLRAAFGLALDEEELAPSRKSQAVARHQHNGSESCGPSWRDAAARAEWPQRSRSIWLCLLSIDWRGEKLGWCWP